MERLSKKAVFIIGLVAIIIVYSVYNIYFNPVDVGRLPTKTKHINKFISIMLVYGIGTLALKRLSVNWMMVIWHLVHITIISILVTIGLYYWWKGNVSVSARNIANTLHDVLISPVLYVSMGIINYRLLRQSAQ